MELDIINKKIKVAQYGTQHGHAASVLSTMLANPFVDVAGVYEPDIDIRNSLIKDSTYPWNNVTFFKNVNDLFAKDIIAVASEGSNIQSLQHTYDLLENGKHVFYDKPAGDNFALFSQCIELAKKKNLYLQMGYMFRNHSGFQIIADIVKSNRLGIIHSIRAHMSTKIQEPMRKQISSHKGGIFFDLAGHVIDQIVYLLGSPNKITSFIRKDFTLTPNFSDNCLSVFEYENALAFIDISSNEPPPLARRFEVYGSKGSLIMEPFEPAQTVRVNIPSENPNEVYLQVKDYATSFTSSDTARYSEGFSDFINVITNDIPPRRTYEHEIAVQETLLKAVGLI